MQAQHAEMACHLSSLEEDATSCASLSLTDFLTPLRSDARATPGSSLSAQTPWQSVSSTQSPTSAQPSQAEQDVEVVANKGGRAYPRKLAASHKDREGVALASHMTRMRAYYAEVLIHAHSIAHLNVLAVSLVYKDNATLLGRDQQTR